MVELDEDILTQLKELFDEEFKDMVQLYLDDTQKTLAGLEGALLGNELDAVKLAAHSLKGSARNMGAFPLSESWARIEDTFGDLAPNHQIDGDLQQMVEDAVVGYQAVAAELRHRYLSL